MIDCEKIIKRKGKKNKNTIRNCKLGIISAIYILKLFFFNFLVFFFHHHSTISAVSPISDHSSPEEVVVQISSVGGLRKLQEKVFFQLQKWKNITLWSKIIPRIIKFVSKNMLPADLNNAAEHQVIPMGPEKIL